MRVRTTLQPPSLSLRPQKGKNHPRFGVLVSLLGGMCSTQGRVCGTCSCSTGCLRTLQLHLCIPGAAGVPNIARSGCPLL